MTTQRNPSGEGSTLARLAQWIPDEEAARQWFEAVHFPGGDVHCLRCGSGNVYRCKHKTMPFRCRSCKKYFSVKTGTAIEASNLPLKTWVWAIYLEVNSPAGISSMALHRALGVRQATAWFILHRIREGLAPLVDRVRSSAAAPSDAIIGALGECESDPSHPNANHPRAKALVGRHASSSESSVANEHRAPNDLDPRSVAQNSEGHSPRAGDLTSKREPDWTQFRQSYNGTFRRMSEKHLGRYMGQFAGKMAIRDMGTRDQVAYVAQQMVGRRVRFRDLIA